MSIGTKGSNGLLVLLGISICQVAFAKLQEGLEAIRLASYKQFEARALPDLEKAFKVGTLQLCRFIYQKSLFFFFYHPCPY